MNAPIRGKVAKIFNSRQLAINVGASDGVSEGMYFDVNTPLGEDIKDPVTGESLGSIDLPKIRLRVTQVSERLSVATTREQQVNVADQSPLMGEFAKKLLSHRFVTRYETLKSGRRTSSEAWEEMDETESCVKIGDPVVQVVQDSSL